MAPEYFSFPLLLADITIRKLTAWPILQEAAILKKCELDTFLETKLKEFMEKIILFQVNSFFDFPLK